MGIDTESGARQCLASELGLKYEDTLILQQRSDSSTFYFFPPGGSFGTPYIMARHSRNQN